eukprot:scaffold28215_cov114-Skeletonema_marinoi.AAC.1
MLADIFDLYPPRDQPSLKFLYPRPERRPVRARSANNQISYVNYIAVVMASFHQLDNNARHVFIMSSNTTYETMDA